MSDPLKIGIAGLGTVGTGVLAFLEAHPQFGLGGRTVQVTGVCARSRSRARPVSLEGMTWFDDPVELAKSADTDVFIELIGGSDGPAKASVEAALKAGKPVITANKALIAEHGADLALLADQNGTQLHFEAAVMGGAPAIKLVREALVGEEIDSLLGILNGTCNYILSEMERTGADFGDVLAEAQRLGYAEADPTTDVGGFDAAHKIVILAALAFGGVPDLAGARISGIDTVEGLDIRMAGELGYRIRLIASAEKAGSSSRVQVRPTLVPRDHPLGLTTGPTNALFVEGARIGRMFLQGPGAGAGPTAAAVIADIADVLSGARRPAFSVTSNAAIPDAVNQPAGKTARAYIRIRLKDEPGAIASVSECLAEHRVSIDSLMQRPASGETGVPIVLTTHHADESDLDTVIKQIATLPAVVDPPRMFFLAELG